MIIASSFYKRSAAVPQFWDGFQSATIDMMPKALKDEFLKVKNDEAALLNMFNKDVERMKAFKDWSEEQIKSITTPTLIVNGNNDVGSVEHAVEMFRTMPNAQLAILPGNHGSYMGTTESLDGEKWTQQYVADIINEFFDR
ncbi:MAG: alpha/beta fold hydrolase [Segetibacter sp.]